MRHSLCERTRSQLTRAPWRITLLLAMAMTVAGLVGCSGGHGDRGALYSVEGRVIWNQQPLAGARVVFYPQGLSDPKAAASHAQTDANGRFRLSTYEADDGAHAGGYAVTVLYYPMRPQDGGAGPNVLPKKYASPKTTDLRIQITTDAATQPLLVLSDERQAASYPGQLTQRIARQ